MLAGSELLLFNELFAGDVAVFPVVACLRSLALFSCHVLQLWHQYQASVSSAAVSVLSCVFLVSILSCFACKLCFE